MRLAPRIWLPLIFVFRPVIAQAVDTTQIMQSQSIEIVLYDPASKAPSRAVRVRDAESRKLAQVLVQKPTPESNTWTGFFVIQFFRGDNAPRTLEFLNGESAYFVYPMREKNFQRIILFPTEGQLNKYIAKVGPPKLDGGAKPTTQAEVLQQVRQETRQQEQTQLAAEEDQAKRRGHLLEQFQKLSDGEKAKRRAQATRLAKEGSDFFTQQKFTEAGSKYLAASEVDPEEDSYVYRYGVSLYKSDDFNKSLAVLSMADAPSGAELEKDYYLGLNYLKLKDYDKAIKRFVDIRDEQDPSLSPAASYYAGTLQIQQQKFADARKSMEFVLDNSQDPALDKSAEEALEQIDRLENFYNKQKEIFRFNFFAGAVYDENVLNIASNNVATDVKAYRANYGFNATGYWFHRMDSELATKLAVSDYYSMDTNFKGNAALQTADPLDLSLSIPYHRQFETLSWDIEPMYRSIYMSPTGGNRIELIRSIGGSSTWSALVRNSLYLTGRLDYSSDKSYLTVSSPEDAQSGSKYGATITPTFLLDLKGEKTLSPELSYAINQADGVNYRYKRLGVALTYTFPGWWTSNANARLDYGNQSYAEATTSRTDTSIALTLGLNKDLNKAFNLALAGQYNVANSPVEVYKYNKFVFTSLLTYTTSILGK